MDPFIGQILMFGGNFAPRGWALCDGTLLAISQNQALFSILGTTYGGDGRTTFALPDLRGRVPMHPGSGPGLSTRRLGQKGGTETNVLNTNQLPSHSHAASASGSVRPQATNGGGDESNPGGGYPATASTDLYAETPNTTLGESPVSVNVTIGNTGANQSVNNVQPFQCVNYIIALVGTFPSRN
ncbi:MAG: tail fiber protein [Bacteroidota bacterium]